jgi:5-methylcytosine-specific restriction endonuclease McrA
MPLTGKGRLGSTKAMIAQFTDDQKFTDEQERYLHELLKNELAVLGGWPAMHGFNQGFLCAYCDRDFCASYDDFYSLIIEHIIPKCRGGKHTFENTLLSCRACNFLKHRYLPIGNSRVERIADARRHVKALRAMREAAVAELRLFVRGASPATRA